MDIQLGFWSGKVQANKMSVKQYEIWVDSTSMTMTTSDRITEFFDSGFMETDAHCLHKFFAETVEEANKLYDEFIEGM